LSLLAASLFTPLPYCKYGCPTGALFEFLKTRQSASEKFRLEDGIALLFVAFAVALFYFGR
jgi:hypothetical protein